MTDKPEFLRRGDPRVAQHDETVAAIRRQYPKGRAGRRIAERRLRREGLLAANERLYERAHHR